MGTATAKSGEISATNVARAFAAGGLYAAMIMSGVGVVVASAKNGAEIAVPILQAELVRIHDGGPARVNTPQKTLLASLGKP